MSNVKSLKIVSQHTSRQLTFGGGPDLWRCHVKVEVSAALTIEVAISESRSQQSAEQKAVDTAFKIVRALPTGEQS